MGSHRYYQHAEIPHPHPGPPLEGEGDFAWLNNVANQEGIFGDQIRLTINLTVKMLLQERASKWINQLQAPLTIEWE